MFLNDLILPTAISSNYWQGKLFVKAQQQQQQMRPKQPATLKSLSKPHVTANVQLAGNQNWIGWIRRLQPQKAN